LGQIEFRKVLITLVASLPRLVYSPLFDVEAVLDGTVITVGVVDFFVNKYTASRPAPASNAISPVDISPTLLLDIVRCLNFKGMGPSK
jgi:hypothetical protein